MTTDSKSHHLDHPASLCIRPLLLAGEGLDWYDSLL